MMIPFANQFYILVIQLGFLGIMDGIYMCFIVTISFDLVKSSKLANQGCGFFHLLISPSVVGKQTKLLNKQILSFFYFKRVR